MKKQVFDGFVTDRGGRRRISDRRFNVPAEHTPEQRTGWLRRSGWDRRFREIQVLIVNERRIDMSEQTG